MANGKSLTVARLQQELQETSLEADARTAGNFADVEGKLLQRWSPHEVGSVDKATAALGSSNPFSKSADPKDDKVWLLDSTAYRPASSYPDDPQPWQAEFVAAFFHNGRQDVGKFVANIADQIGLDGQLGGDEEAEKRIEERKYGKAHYCSQLDAETGCVQPFIDAIAPATCVDVSIPCTTSQPHVHTLGPSNANGISNQIVLIGGDGIADGTVITTTSINDLFPSLSAHTRFAGPDGWAIISDIDDTIKVTHTTDPIGTLRTTFADIPKATEGLPEFYQVLDTQFENPAWFYISASPYNLYPFIRQFIHDHYKPGTIILRDLSWMALGGLLKSLTEGIQAYKADRMNKIHDWLPNRKFICIGDSTQSDPETYAEMFKKFPGWIRLILIRAVEDEPYMTEKNKPERFEKAFEGVPSDIWRLFTHPQKDLAEHVKHVAEEANTATTGALQDYLSSHEQRIKDDQRTESPNADSGRPAAVPQGRESLGPAASAKK